MNGKTPPNPNGVGRKRKESVNHTLRLMPGTIALLREQSAALRKSQNELADEILSAGLKSRKAVSLLETERSEKAITMPFDLQLLSLAIKTVEEGLASMNREATLKKKAEMIVAAYGIYFDMSKT